MSRNLYNLLLCCMALMAVPAAGRQIRQTVTDTSGAVKTGRSPSLMPAPVVPGKPDSAGYNNPAYNKGIKTAEYQNRGAEDRRDPHSADPNAIPNRRVPEKKVLPPPSVK